MNIRAITAAAIFLGAVSLAAGDEQQGQQEQQNQQAQREPGRVTFIDVVGDPADINQPALLRAGSMIGRDGAAFGFGPVVEVNLKKWIGVYVFAGTSQVNGYQNGEGVTANFRDRSLGVGLNTRWLEWRKIDLGIFAQASYYGSHVNASYFDPESGGIGQYHDSTKGQLVTVGPSIERPVWRGIHAFVRLGKNFGDKDNIAANTVGGFSINGGVMFDVFSLTPHAQKVHP